VSARSILSRSARRGVRAAARVADTLAPPARGVVVLAYHQVGAPQAGAVNLTPAAFDQQMAMLAAQRMAGRVVPLDQAVAAVDAPAPPRDLVAITFDDGTADFVDHALPVLVRHDLPVTLYLATAFVEEGRSFWDDGTVLSWNALRDALTTGLVTIGTHTHTHALLDRVAADVAADELDRSIGLVHDRLGVAATHFAYPKAVAPRPGSPAADAVRARVTSAAVAGGRANRYGRTDRWRLSRTPVVAVDDLDTVARKATGGLRLEGEVRERLDRIRYAGATS
jgi:peptidoglycan/xylan/chitin deacetylase (PgdA/CDA1 family)